MQTTLSAGFAIDAALHDAVRRAAGLEALRAGRHILRDAQRRKTGETVVRRLWVARVQPPAAPPGCLACLTTDARTTIAIAVPEGPEGRSAAADVLELDPHWPDPVAAALTAVDLWSGGHGIPLAGCSYGLFVETAQVQAVVRFSNPLDPSRLALQAALLDVATLFAAEVSEDAAKVFLERWAAAAGATSLI